MTLELGKIFEHFYQKCNQLHFIYTCVNLWSCRKHLVSILLRGKFSSSACAMNKYLYSLACGTDPLFARFCRNISRPSFICLCGIVVMPPSTTLLSADVYWEKDNNPEQGWTASVLAALSDKSIDAYMLLHHVHPALVCVRKPIWDLSGRYPTSLIKCCLIYRHSAFIGYGPTCLTFS